MPRLGRQILIVAMLSCYGVVSLCGSGLHVLLEHDSSCVATKTGHPADGWVLKAWSGHCPICEFQAQGQLPVDPVRLVSRPYTSPLVTLILTRIAARDRYPTASPRAPPLFLATVA